ncbi:alpha/beta fold hydrolase [Flavobacterium sp. W21_SRS_FM6]|uniref:alpha/beta fold hydrolase n=1 Tax=Flavobacterium sp. W21_SRS_FM6 TaxID=3240268 RepID=UPI003F90F807
MKNHISYEAPTLLLLPGIDGSGKLYAPLLDVLPSNIKVQLAPLPEALFTDHSEIANHVLATLSDKRYVILAESFSGRTAYELCRLAPKKFVYVVFGASFITQPSRLLSFARFMPLRLLNTTFLAKVLVGGLAMKLLLKNKLTNPFIHNLTALPGAFLKNRLRLIHQLPQPNLIMDVPCLIVTAKQDRLVSCEASAAIKRVFSQHAEQKIRGPHCLVQTRPKHFAKVFLTLYRGLADNPIRTPAKQVFCRTM